jgi:hypothetical protein
MSNSKGESMPVCIFDSKEIICYEFSSKTASQASYLQVWNIYGSTFIRTPYFWPEVRILHHDTFSPTPLSVKHFLTKKQMPVLEHPLYLPDLVPCDFSMFLKLRSHFESLEDIQRNMMTTERTFGKQFLALFPDIAEVFECMYKVLWY